MPALPVPTHISLRDALLALSIVGLWGLHVVIIRIGALEIPPLLLLSIRFALAGMLFLPFAKRLSAVQLKAVALYALPYLVLHLGTIFVALKYIEASIGGLILQLEGPFLIVLGMVFFGERFGLKTSIGLLLAALGVLVIMYQPVGSGFSYLGAVLLVISSFAWAAGSLRMRFIQGVDFASMTFYSHMIALPFVALLSFVFESGHGAALAEANWMTVGGVLSYQVFVMTVCLYLWKGLMQRNPAYEVTAFTLTQPVFSTIFGVIILGEVLPVNAVIGGAIALVGVLIVTVRKMQKAEAQPAAEAE